MKINLIQIIFIGICVAVTIYFTYATINEIVTGGNVIDIGGETVTLNFLDYGMIQFYIFMAVMTFLLFMLGGGGGKD